MPATRTAAQRRFDFPGDNPRDEPEDSLRFTAPGKGERTSPQNLFHFAKSSGNARNGP